MPIEKQAVEQSLLDASQVDPFTPIDQTIDQISKIDSVKEDAKEDPEEEFERLQALSLN